MVASSSDAPTATAAEEIELDNISGQETDLYLTVAKHFDLDAMKSHPQVPVQKKSNGTHSVPPIFRVPSEIRLQILRYLLPTDPQVYRFFLDVSPIFTSLNHWRRPREFHHSLDVLRTNRALYLECLSVMYSENLFHFIGVSPTPVLHFLNRLSMDAKVCMRQLRITLLQNERDHRLENPDKLCMVLHEHLPLLNTLTVDPWRWL